MLVLFCLCNSSIFSGSPIGH